MNLKKKKIIAILLTVVVVASMFGIGSTSFNTNKLAHNSSNIDEYYYISQEIYEISEQKSGNNLQYQKLSNKLVSYGFSRYILDKVDSITNIYKLKYTAFVNASSSIYNDSVFVVSFIHKKDGKKRTSLLSI